MVAKLMATEMMEVLEAVEEATFQECLVLLQFLLDVMDHHKVMMEALEAIHLLRVQAAVVLLLLVKTVLMEVVQTEQEVTEQLVQLLALA